MIEAAVDTCQSTLQSPIRDERGAAITVSAQDLGEHGHVVVEGPNGEVKDGLKVRTILDRELLPVAQELELALGELV
mgnify:CR=1 FL=1